MPTEKHMKQLESPVKVSKQSVTPRGGRHSGAPSKNVHTIDLLVSVLKSLLERRFSKLEIEVSRRSDPALNEDIKFWLYEGTLHVMVDPRLGHGDASEICRHVESAVNQECP